MKIENINDLHEVIIKNTLPEPVIIDVQGRILGYLVGGGDIEDPYIEQQFRYVEKVMRNVKRKEFTQRTLNKLLDGISDKYFDEDNQLAMLKVIKVVKDEYAEEIATLPG